MVRFFSLVLILIYFNIEFGYGFSIIQDQRSIKDSIHSKIDDLNSKGNRLRNQTNFKGAFDFHYQALEIAKEYKDTLGIVFAYNNIANDLRRSGANEQAVFYYLQVLDLTENKSTYQKSQTIAKNGLGNIFLDLKNYDQALQYFEQSLEIETTLESTLGLAINYANIGEVYFQKDDLEKAYDYYKKSYEQNLLISNTTGQAICYSAFSKINLRKGLIDEAVQYANQSIDLISGTNDIYHQLRFEQLLMEIYISSDQLELANQLIDPLIEHSHQLSAPIELKNTFQLLVDLYEAQENYPKIVASQKQLMAYNDSILTTSNDLVILEQQKKYQTERILQQLKILEDQKKIDLKTRNNQILIFSITIIVFIVFMSYLILRNRQKKRLNDELKELTEVRNRFFNNISHEFKTPLTLIIGPIAQLKNSIKTKEYLESINLIEKNANILYQLVVQILNINKLESKSFEVYFQEGYLDILIDQVSENFNFQVLEKSVKVKKELKPSELLKVDRSIVSMIINNLMSNALKYCPNGSVIKLTGKPIDGYYKFSIENEIKDLSIDPNQIFEKYYSKRNSSQEGTGLGLHLVKELCDLYDTEINVVYNENKSIVFELSFPIISANKSLEAPLILSDEEQIIQENESVDLPLMLIVEDNPDMATYIKSLFIDNFNVIIANNGKEGISMGVENLPEIIISDVMMPIVNGIDLCKKIKTNPITNHIPIILLSANTKEETLVQGLKNQCDDYMVKPFVNEILIAKVENLIKLRRVLVEKYRTNLKSTTINKISKIDDPFHAQILELIENEISDPNFNVDFLCRSLYMSRTQLHRKLKAIFDMSATEFINFHRLKIAADLLLNSNLNITEVCFECGYNSPSYFSKQFKNFFGISPQNFIAENKL